VHPAPRAVAPGSLEQRPVTALKGVGEALATRLEALGVHQVQDLLFVLPSRYEDRTRVVPIGAAVIGTRAVVEGEVQLTEAVYRRRRQLLCRISDGSGFLTLRFFYFSGAQQQSLARGTRIRCFGEVRRGPLGAEMVHPEYRRVFGGESGAMEDRLTPIYPTTEGLAQGRLRALVDQALRELGTAGVHEWLPPEILQTLALPTLREALEYVHRPPVDAELEVLEAGEHPAQKRLAFEELLTHHLVLRLIRQQVQTDPAWPLDDPKRLAEAFVAALPFRLTDAQQRAFEEVDADLGRERPMVRLVQGDVGCGKTVVAAAAAARAVGSGRQAALMAPTELLADQHFRNLQAWFQPLGVTVALLTGSQPARTRRSALELTASGEAPIVVGTHALFQEGVEFNGPRAGDRRRAAPLRRAAAHAARGEGAGQRPPSAPADHDGDADPADAGDDGLCRPRRLGDRRAAAGPHAGAHRRRARDAARRGGRAHRGGLPPPAARPTGSAR
jgi:ATP-dependent DNA helicase RecG